MSVVNVSNFLVELNKKISNTTNDKELLMLTKALEKLKTGVVFTVGTFANLPDPTENVGKLYFVEADALLYFSFITEYGSFVQWSPITNVSANILWSWGDSLSGITPNRCSPGTVSGGGFTWCQIEAKGNNTASAIKTDGTLWTWGCGGGGRLGDGTTVTRISPGTVFGGGTTWCKSTGIQNFGGTGGMAAIKTDGTLWTWGFNCSGSLGDGTTVSRCSPGTIFGGGTTWCDVSTIRCGGAAIKTDGTLWTWGSGLSGGLGDGTTITRCSPGTTWGSATTWCKVCGSGDPNMMAIKTDGTLWTWGCNACGVLGDGTTVNRCSPGTVAGGGTTWCNFIIGADRSAAIKTDGTLWTWGCNSFGELGDGTTVSRCSPGTVAGGGTTWCQISIASYFMSAIKTDGTLWTWGRNQSGNFCGMLGTGETTCIANRCSPGTVAGGGTTWIQVANSANGSAIAITKETL